MINEISILKKLQHKFIVQMIDFQWDNNFIYLIFEFCPGGELSTIIHLSRCFPEEIVQHFLQQLASALQFLRWNNISHLDLKPQNILISGISFVTLLNELNSFKVWRNVVLKIADFGFAQHLSDQEISTSFRGSPLYMAPEILLGHEYDARVDLWSIGVILYQCLFGQTPYHCTSTDDLVHKFKTNQIKISFPSKPKISSNCRDLLKRLLEFDPKVRISFDAFFQHPFIDLEHMPTPESYSKAQQILSEAIQEDHNEHYLQAFYLYRDAIFYLMPLYKWGDLSKPFSTYNQESMKTRIAQYMERAEWLQQKCGLKSIDPKVMTQIQQVYNSIDSAQEYYSKDLLNQSLSEYECAIEKALKILKKSDKVVRTEFFGEINNWMSDAEYVKLKLSKANRKDFSKSSSLKHNKSDQTPDVCVGASGTVVPLNSHPSLKIDTSSSIDLTPTLPPRPQPKRSNWRQFISSNEHQDQEKEEQLKDNSEPSCNIQ